MSSIVIGPVIERIEFLIQTAELIANTTQEFICPVDGYINDIEAVVQKAITTGGTLTLQAGGAVWNLQTYLDTSSFPLPPEGANLILPAVATQTAQLWTAGAPTTPGYVALKGHGYVPGQILTLGGTVPTGFTSGNNYYVSAAGFSADAFNLSSSLANAMAGTSITGSGSNSTTATFTTGVQGIVPVTNQVLTVASSATAGTLYSATAVPNGDVTAPVKRGQLLSIVPASFATAGEVTGVIRIRSNR